MQKIEQLRQQLYEKAVHEQQQFVEQLKLLPPEQIIDAAYEKVMRDDILMTFEDDFLNEKQVKELLKLQYPLSACYNEWMDTDCSYMEVLRDTIDDFANELIKENEPEQKKPDRKKDEYER